uniref:Uncharacterized protein n=1 Tax=Cannabis sativa TaxID=3483 RepID=A0A803Q2H2_CANSA
MRSMFEPQNFDSRSQANGSERGGAAWGLRSSVTGGSDGVDGGVRRWPESGRRSLSIVVVISFSLFDRVFKAPPSSTLKVNIDAALDAKKRKI